MDTNQLLTGGGLVALVIGLTEVAKQLGVATRYIPILAIGISVGLALVLSGGNKDIIIPAVIAGLTASGLWSGTKATIGK